MVNTHTNTPYSQLCSLRRRAEKCLKSCFFAMSLLFMLSSCVTALVASVAIVTVDILHDRRSVGEYIDDGAIELAAKNIVLTRSEFTDEVHLKPQSWNGILLLTGEISSAEIKQQLLPELQSIRGVRQIVDETNITKRSGFRTRANDTWISSKVKSRLVVKTGLSANRVKVVTTYANVYLMGIVTPEEADKAAEHASKVRGVKRVIRVFEYNNKPENNNPSKQ